MKKILLLSLVFFLSGCGTAKTIVLEPVQEKQRYNNVQIVAHNPTVEVPAEVVQVFEGKLQEELFQSGAFAKGSDLQLLYTFVSHEEGDRFARWFWGGIGNAGEGSVTVMVRYVNPAGEELAKTQVEGRIGSGFFGGSIDQAIEKAAEDVAKFTINNFRS